MGLLFRGMNLYDIKAGLALCREANWNQLERDWKLFFEINPYCGCVAVKNNKVVGTVVTMGYENRFSWIGMVLVAQSSRKQGIGKQLLLEAMQILGKQDTVKLDATPAGREVYLKHGFVDEFNLFRMNSTISITGLTDTDATQILKIDLPAICSFDQDIFGADRSFLIEWLWKGNPEFSFVIKKENEILGYCLGRIGFNAIQIGPIVAKDNEIAKKLLFRVLNNCTGKQVFLDITLNDVAWLKCLQELGFQGQRPFVRMYRGKNLFPGVPENQFAIMGPEFG